MGMDKENADSIGAYEAKTHFSELLERVEKGEEVTITKHGAPVARLIPVRKRLTVEERLAISAQMKKFARGNKLRGLSIKDMINEGRR
jgi:prevent-host-death family protein